MQGAQINLLALTDTQAATSSGVAHGGALLAFAAAMVGDEDEA